MKMGFVGVKYEAGQSRHSAEAVDYMLAEIDDVELYAEMKNPTWDEASEQFIDETATYKELKQEIIEQAQQHGIDAARLQFRYDEQ